MTSYKYYAEPCLQSDYNIFDNVDQFLVTKIDFTNLRKIKLQAVF